MNWPWVSRSDYETLRQQFTADLEAMDKELSRVRACVESWEKAVLLAQVMQPQPLPPDIPPAMTELPDAVEKALRRRAQPGTSTYLEMAEDAARQLADGLEPDLVIEDQLRGARPKVW